MSSLRITSITNVPTMLILVACADYLIPLLGDRWEAGTAVLKLLALVGVAKAVILFTGPLLYALAKPQVRTVMVWVLAAISASTFTAVGLVLTDEPPAEQVLGAAGSRAILFVLVFIPVNLAIVSRATGLPLRALVPPFAVPTLSGLVAIGVVWGLGLRDAPAARWLSARAARPGVARRRALRHEARNRPGFPHFASFDLD
jgi:O-antigen/teichoic acid export membrane protein